MKLRTQILLFFFLFALTPLIVAVMINLPLVLERMELFYHKAHLQNLRADFRDLDQHLGSREEMVRLLAKLPEPGTVLGERERKEEEIDRARANYTHWVNRILGNQLDIIQIVFLDQNGRERFWLDRDIKTQEWRPTTERPEKTKEEFVKAALQLDPEQVIVSSITLDPAAGAVDPRRFMTLRLISPFVAANGVKVGAVTMSVDVGGIARRYRNAIWVNNDGSYLEYSLDAPKGNAFEDFPGLDTLFAKGTLALWEGSGNQVIWVPMFRTENSGALWVGRRVDPSPIAQFRNALTFRVLTIVFGLIIVTWFAARWLARRTETMSNQLIDGVQKVLEDEEEVQFAWRGPQEIRKLSDNLSRLAREHGRNTRNLRAHARKLEESNRYKSEFLANVSHELRTPLNSILLLSKLLSDKTSGLRPEQIQQARVIYEAGDDLRTLIDNILDLSRIEAQRVELNIEEIDIRRMAEELVELVRPQYEDKHLPLNIDIDDRVPAAFHSDPDKVRQIIKNFLSNAVKFTDRGEVTLRVAYEPQAEEARRLRISVSDTGIGIAPSNQSHIFEAFRQADGSTNRKYGGTGLGLTISQQLAHLLGGSIVLESREHHGSTFSLELPLIYREGAGRRDTGTAEPPAQESVEAFLPEGSAMSADLSGRRILLVDNDVDNLLRLTPMLERWGMEVTAAGDADEALSVLEEDEAFSVVLIDVKMPCPEAYDTIQSIREEAGPDVALLVLMTSTDGDARRSCLEAGADESVTTPVQAAELKDIIERRLSVAS